MSFKKPYLPLALIGLVLAAGAAWWFQNKPAAPKAELAAAGAAPNSAAQPAPASAGAPAAGAAPGSGAPQRPPAVEVAKVEKAMLVDETQSVGSLRSFQGVILRPEVGGRVSQVLFKDGQKVKRDRFWSSLTINCLLLNWLSPKLSCQLRKLTTRAIKSLSRKTSSANVLWMNPMPRFKLHKPNWHWPKPPCSA